MPAFNVVQKRRRAAIAESKRAKHGDPLTSKLKQKRQFVPISGKRKRKLFKKWRREEKEGVARSEITMSDVDMTLVGAELGASQKVDKPSPKFNMKKSLKLRLKQSKKKGKKKGTLNKIAEEASADAMVE